MCTFIIYQILHIKFQMVWELPPSNWRLYTYMEWSLCCFIVHKKKPTAKGVYFKGLFWHRIWGFILASGKNKKLASCSYCLIYHPNFCFYHLGRGFECKNSQHSCQHNDKSKDNTKWTVTLSIKMELCNTLGFGNNVVKDPTVLGYGAASPGHWRVMFPDSIVASLSRVKCPPDIVITPCDMVISHPRPVSTLGWWRGQGSRVQIQWHYSYQENWYVHKKEFYQCIKPYLSLCMLWRYMGKWGYSSTHSLL